MLVVNARRFDGDVTSCRRSPYSLAQALSTRPRDVFRVTRTCHQDISRRVTGRSRLLGRVATSTLEPARAPRLSETARAPPGMSRQGSSSRPERRADWTGDGQRVRPVQHRDRPVELAHGRPDAGRRPVRHRPGRRRPAGSHHPGAGRAVRLPRRHRARPRQRQRGALGSGGRGSGDRRHRARARCRAAEIVQTGRLRLAGTAPDRLRPRRRPGPAPPPVAAVPPQRDDLHRVRGRRRCSPSAPTTRSAAASCWTTTAPATRDRARPDAGAVPVPHRRRAAAALRASSGLSISRGDAGQRVRPPARGRGPGRAAADLGG